MLVGWVKTWRHQAITWNNVHKNIEKHTAHTIVSWPNPKQWVIVHTSDLMMMIRQSINIHSSSVRSSDRADSRLAPSQWGMSLQSNAASHWLGANLEPALNDNHIGWVIIDSNDGPYINQCSPIVILVWKNSLWNFYQNTKVLLREMLKCLPFHLAWMCHLAIIWNWGSAEFHMFWL